MIVNNVKCSRLSSAATGLFVALYTALDGYSVKFLALSPLLLQYFSNSLRTVFMLPLFIRNHREVRDEWKKNGKYAFGIGAVSALAFFLLLYAMQSAPISHVAPLREISMPFDAVFGVRLLDEEQRREKLIGAGLMVLGVKEFAMALAIAAHRKASDCSLTSLRSSGDRIPTD